VTATMPKPKIETSSKERAGNRDSSGYVLVAMSLLLVLALVGSSMLGSYSLGWRDWWRVISDSANSGISGIVLLQIRLPRLLACTLVGAGLALAGASYQGLFNNPMVSPDILGASAGAGFGAALGILCGFSIVAIQGMSFLFGVVAVLLAWGLGSVLCRRGDPVLMLVLVGILVGSLFTAMLSLAKYVADPYNKLPVITYWLLGSFASITPRDVAIAAVPICTGCIPLLLLRWRLNVLCMGEQEARTLGVNTLTLRFIVIACATLITAVSVSICGMIGWIGLVIPHLARFLVGPNYRVLLPCSALMGACFLLLVDDLARTAGPLEIPVGVLTAFIGSPFFLLLLFREGRNWS
jgi:iron complex transport system permease protein